MASIPIRMAKIATDTGGATPLANVMSAVWADIGANSTWTQVTQTNVTNAGDQSFAIQSPDTTLQLNMINAGSNQARLGINPDGATNPIANSISPHTGVPNFSGTDGGKLVFSPTPAGAIILVEWPDAIMLIMYFSPADCRGAYHWGKIWLQPITGLESTTGGTRLDGFAIAPGSCSKDAVTNSQAWWPTTGSSVFRRRCSTGQTNETDTAINPVTAWAEHKWRWDPSGIADAAFQYSGQRVALPIMLYPADTAAADAWVWKYVRMVGEQLPVFQMIEIDGVDTYMTLNVATAPSANCSIAIPIIDGFDPNQTV